MFNKIKNMQSKKRIVLVGFLAIMSVVAVAFFINKNTKVGNVVVARAIAEKNGAVQPTRINISSTKDDSYGSGGIISQTTSEDPAVKATFFNHKSSAADIVIYKAEEDDLTRYIIHDKDGKQLNENADTSKMKIVSAYSGEVTAGGELQVALPNSDAGIWFISISMDGEKEEAFVVRSSFGAIVSDGDGELIFWAQDFNTKNRLPGVQIELYNFTEKKDKLASTTTDSFGIGKLNIDAGAEVVFMKKDSEIAILPINKRYLNWGSYTTFAPKEISRKFFVFTDRPIYQPGDNVNFKAIVRNEDDVRFSVPIGEIQIDVSETYYADDVNEKVYSQKLKISESGSVAGDFVLPKTLKTGNYYLSAKIVTSDEDENNHYSNIGAAIFNVEHYQKPEYGIDLISDKDEMIAGETLSVKIAGNYFSGQPIANKKVKYRIYSSDFQYYNYYSDYEYSVNNNEYRRYYGYNNGIPISEGEATLDADGNVEIKIGNDITSQGQDKFGDRIFTVETEFSDESGIPVFDAKNIFVNAGSYSILRSGYKYGYKVGDNVSLGLGLISHDDSSISDVPLKADISIATWKRVEVSGRKYAKYEKEVENLPVVSVKSDQTGKAQILFDALKAGSYEIVVSGVDKNENVIRKSFSVWVSDRTGFYWGAGNENSGLRIQAGKDKYNPDETVKLNISSNVPDRDIFLSLERGRVNRYQIIHLNGNSAEIDIPLVGTDIPNIFASISSFSYDNLDSANINIKVSTESKKINVSFVPDKDRYNPGDQVNIEVKTTNAAGLPISTETAVWAVDKAIFELASSKASGIFNAFWYERYNNTERNHSLMGIISDGAEKGGGGDDSGGRSIFKDTAYWNPYVQTNSKGTAKIAFKLPDNLTTWVISGISDTEDTSVGEGKKEIIVSKDVIIRPILPNIMRVGDVIELSALVHNFSDNKLDFKIDFKMDGADVDSQMQNISVDSKGAEQIFWKVKPTVEAELSNMTFSAISSQENFSDIVTKVVPVRKFGFWETGVQIGEGEAQQYLIKIAPDVDREKTRISLSIAPTLLGTLPEAMKYLVDYPYGCVEQTTSRFVPAVIAKKNPEIFKDSIADKNIEDIIKKGIEHLGELQGSDGGWGWYGENSDPFITAYVVEYLIEAKNLGFMIESSMMDDAKMFLERDFVNIGNKRDYNEALVKRDEIFAKVYALSLVDSSSQKGKEMLYNFDNITADVLAMGVLANLRNGFSDPNTNGLSQLILMAKEKGDGLFWSTGAEYYFGSDDASTALAIRAITASGQNKDVAMRGIRFLTANRKSNYWSNTFATANSIKAIVDFSKINTELSPQYAYAILLDGEEIGSSSISKFNQLNEFSIPADKIKSTGSTLSIRKNGEGGMYGTLINKQFLTDKNSPAVSNGLTIERTYQNITNPGQNLHVGDIAMVLLKVSGLTSERDYAVIQDELPSGLVPINNNLQNEQFNDGANSNTYDYYSYNKEITENGMILTTYRIGLGVNMYSYYARVMSEGIFSTPPATVGLMYLPEVFGRSVSEIMVIDNSSFVQINNAIAQVINSDYKAVLNVMLLVLCVFIPVGIISFVGYKKYRNKLNG
jgi:uncharacterized protein YfaS (alpha-2-macroglobulin family)